MRAAPCRCRQASTLAQTPIPAVHGRSSKIPCDKKYWANKLELLCYLVLGFFSKLTTSTPTSHSILDLLDVSARNWERSSSEIVNPRSTMASSSSALKKGYLIAYNSASAIAWTTILGRVVAVLLLKGPHMVPLAVDNFARVTQTFATLEILHSILGSSYCLDVPSPCYYLVLLVFVQATR